MTESFTLVDAVLWSLAVALGLAAVWFARPRRDEWDFAQFFVNTWASLSGDGSPPLDEGPRPRIAESGSPEDPVRRLGAGVTPAALAAGTPAVRLAVDAGFHNVRVVWFETPTVDVGVVDVLPAPPLAHAALEALLAPPERRLVLVASRAAQAMLELLFAMEGLRDRVRAVLLVGASPDADWVRREFRHDSFDVELAGDVPYCTLRTGVGQVLRQPEPPENQRTSVRVVDLGVVAPEHLADPALGAALRISLAALLRG